MTKSNVFSQIRLYSYNSPVKSQSWIKMYVIRKKLDYTYALFSRPCKTCSATCLE